MRRLSSHTLLQAYRIILASFLTLLFFIAFNSLRAQKKSHQEENQKFHWTRIEEFPVIFIDTEEGSDVSFSFTFNVGGITDEILHGKKLAGLSHFLEHTLTTSSMNHRYEDQKVFEELSKLGKDVNAMTSRDSTTYYWLGVAENSVKAIQLYSDLVFNPEFSPKAIEIERSAIQDEKTSYLQDLSSATYYGSLHALYDTDSPYTSNIIGDTGSIASISRDHLIQHWNQFYHAENAAITIAGNFSKNPNLKSDLTHEIKKALQSQRTNPFYNQKLRESSSDLIRTTKNTEPKYRDSSFRNILVKNSDALPSLDIRISLQQNAAEQTLNPFVVEYLQTLLSLESPENPIYDLKTEGLSTLPSFEISIDGKELILEAKMDLLEEGHFDEILRGSSEILKIYAEPIFARITQIAENKIPEAYQNFAKNLIKNEMELARSRNLSLSHEIESYLSLVGDYGITWDKILESYNLIYNEDARFALKNVHDNLRHLLSKPIQEKAFRYHWLTVSKEVDSSLNYETTPYPAIKIQNLSLAPKLLEENYASKLRYQDIDEELRNQLEINQEEHLSHELLNLSFQDSTFERKTPKITIQQEAKITSIVQTANIAKLQNSVVVRFRNLAPDDLGLLNLDLFVASFQREYSKELSIVQNHLANVSMRPFYDRGFQNLDFTFVGEPQKITELAPRVLNWFAQHRVTPKMVEEIKKMMFNGVNEVLNGNIWRLSRESFHIKQVNFRSGISDHLFYLSESNPISPEELESAKMIFDGAEVYLSAAGNFSPNMIDRLKEGSLRLRNDSSVLLTSNSVKKNRLNFRNLDADSERFLSNPISRKIEGENALVLKSFLQVSPHVDLRNLVLTDILSSMLHERVFRINREEKNLGYYHVASSFKNEDGLHMVFGGKIETDESLLNSLGMMQNNWNEAARRILDNAADTSRIDFTKLVQSKLDDLRSSPRALTLAIRNLTDWLDLSLSNDQSRAKAIEILENMSFEEDFLPLLRKTIPGELQSNRLTYMLNSKCEAIFRDDI